MSTIDAASPPRSCPKCGYDLRYTEPVIVNGLTRLTCPECGRVSTLAEAGRRRGSRTTPDTGLLALCLAALAILLAMPGLLEWAGGLLAGGLLLLLSSLCAIVPASGVLVLRKVAGLRWSWVGVLAVAVSLVGAVNTVVWLYYLWRPYSSSPAARSARPESAWVATVFFLWAAVPLLVMIDAILVWRSCRRLGRS